MEHPELSFEYNVENLKGREVHQLWIKDFIDLGYPIVGNDKEMLLMNAKMLFLLLKRFEVFTPDELMFYEGQLEDVIGLSLDDK